MKFSMAEFWGMVTLTVFAFAGLKLIVSLPEAIAAVMILSFPIRAIVEDLVRHMERGNRKGQRIK